jgi:hypothetical protein
MCWGFQYRIGHIKDGLLDKKLDDDSVKYDNKWKDVDSTTKIVELCKEIGISIPKSISKYTDVDKDACLCVLTEDEKKSLLGELALHTLNRFRPIEIHWL